MEPDEYRRFYETKIHRVFLSTVVDLRDPENLEGDPVYSRTRVWPFLEAVESTLKQLLFAVKSLTPEEYEYVKSGLIGFLADAKLSVQVDIGDPVGEDGRAEVQTVERPLRVSGTDFPLR